MRILALHDIDSVATLLTELTAITEVEASSVPNIEKFKEYLDRYQFDAVFILDKFFPSALEILFNHKNQPLAVGIFYTDEESLTPFLNLGLNETNIETIPFNPLGYFVKVKTLVNTTREIKEALKGGVDTFDFYKHGLFNLLNVLTKTGKDLFVSVKDLEEEQILYSLRIRNGQVIACNQTIEKVREVNTDDSTPKSIVIGPVTFEDKEVFKGTAHFYRALLGVENQPQPQQQEEKAPSAVVSDIQKPQKVAYLRETLLRERRIYKVPFKGFEIYSQPYEEIRQFTGKEVFAVPLLDERVISNLQLLRVKNRYLKLLASPLVKAKLKLLGFKEENFINFEGSTAVDLPFLGNKFESFIFLPNGVGFSGNLLGSFVSKDVDFMERVFFGHLRVYHYCNITSNERLKSAIEKIEPFKESLHYLIPAYGYAFDKKSLEPAYQIVQNLLIPQEYKPLSEGWSDLAAAYGLNVSTYEEFLKALQTKDSSLLFNLIDDMEVLGLVPFEF